MQHPPLSVGEHADVPLPEFVGALRDVPGQLLRRRRQHRRRGQRLLDLDRSAPGLYVDAPSTTGLRLERHVDQVATAQVQGRVEQERADVGLHVGLRASDRASGETCGDLLKGCGRHQSSTLHGEPAASRRVSWCLEGISLGPGRLKPTTVIGKLGSYLVICRCQSTPTAGVRALAPDPEWASRLASGNGMHILA